MKENKTPYWVKNPPLNEMENLMENMNEAMDLFKQLLMEKRAQLITVQNRLREEENGRT